MLHARTHPQCSRSRAGSRVQLVSVVIGPTILPTDAKCTRASEGRKKERAARAAAGGLARERERERALAPKGVKQREGGRGKGREGNKEP